jgi:DNA-binding NarL/FixJ family response regulator
MPPALPTVVLADDHEVVRRGVRSILEADGGYKVVAEVADGLAAVQAAEKFRPTLMFLDLSMPRLHGLEALRQVRAGSPQTKVIVLSMHNDEPYVVEALRAGAMAYILKGSESTEIARAVAEVVAGRRYLSAPLSERAITALTTQTADQADPLHALTPREREVLLLAAEGLNTTVMAEKLFISPRTAETHRTNLMQKLGLQTQTDLVRFAIRRGLIQP